MTDYEVTATFTDGQTLVYDMVPFAVARSVYYGFVKDPEVVNVTYRGRGADANVELFRASDR